MVDRLPVGPYRTVDIGSGLSAPFYIIPFDKDGVCTGPATRDHLLTAVGGGEYTDVFLFSHGWNNDWAAATGRYEDFLAGYLTLARDRNLAHQREVRPLLVGVFWPSTALVLPSEREPDIAAADPAATDAAVARERDEVRELASAVAPADRERFYDLAQRDGLADADALEFARILAPVFTGSEDEVPLGEDEPDTDDLPRELLNIWRSTATVGVTVDTSGETGLLIEDGDGSATNGPEAAGITDFLDPRKIVRAATVFQMKDRAGTVGAHGVGSLLRGILDADDAARVHLIGHSYGCKVVLSALCFAPPPRPVDSILLLQPALSHLCFAADAADTGKPGGYRAALERVKQPILTTFSPHDRELRHLFHLAVRRKKDIGEAQIAGGAPSRFAALGGWGPGGCAGECVEQPINPVGTPYPTGGDGSPIRVIGLDGTEVIGSHGGISNEHTWWALRSQVGG